MLILQDDTLEAICSHAQEEYPKECCGIMLGTRNGEQRIAHRVIKTRNMAGKSRNVTHFLMNPFEIVEAELLAEKEQLEIVGFYHSHPDYEAAASVTDLHYMMAGYSYSIVSVIDGRSVNVKSFEKLEHSDQDAKEEILEKRGEGTWGFQCMCQQR
ncbi:MAG: M67 family metallopeptidase [Clostridiales bacterium]|nr:M67 family metallopeptidase [Clostridiales bacterium]